MTAGSVVLDASVWVDVLLGRAPAARVWQRGATFVPPHFAVEVGASLRGLLLRGVLDDGQASALMVDYHAPVAARRFRVERLDADDLAFAWSLRHEMTLGDAVYVAVARRLRLPWLTHDERAGQSARRHVEVLGPS